jgi:hypothetical protein
MSGCSQQEPDYPNRNGDEEKAEQTEYGSRSFVGAVVEERLVIDVILVAHDVFLIEDPGRGRRSSLRPLVVTFGFLC